MSNEELVALVQSGIDEAGNMERLYEQTKNFIRKLAKPYLQYSEMDDLLQEGYIGLYQAVKRYRPQEGVLFLTYAGYWVKQGLRWYIDNCCRIVRIPVGTAADIAKYNRLVREYSLCHGEPPSDRQMASFMELDMKQLRKLKKDARMAKISSLDEPVGEDSDNTLAGLVPSGEDVESQILDKVEYGQLQNVLWSLVDSLPDDGGLVIRERYQNRKTFECIGELIGSSSGRVRTIERKALRELRKPSRSRQLRPFAEEFINDHAYRRCGVMQFNTTWVSSVEHTVLKLLELEEKNIIKSEAAE